MRFNHNDERYYLDKDCVVQLDKKIILITTVLIKRYKKEKVVFVCIIDMWFIYRAKENIEVSNRFALPKTSKTK